MCTTGLKLTELDEVVYAWLVVTFNYLILWVKVLGSVNYNHNPKHIYNPNSDPNHKLTLIITPH